MIAVDGTQKASVPPLQRKAMLQEKRQAEETIKKEMAGARLGYAVLNLLDPGVTLLFGEYNNRAQNKKAVMELVHGFRSLGVQHYEHPMPIAVRSDWVEAGCLSSVADDDKIKMIQWTSKAEGGQVTVLGGQHRRAAVLEYKKQLEVEEGKLKSALAGKKKKLGSSGGEGGDEKGKGRGGGKKDAMNVLREDVADLEDKLEHVQGTLSDLGKWTVEVYDLGEC